MSITRFPLHQQWGHIGSELERAISRQTQADTQSYHNSIERILNMISEMIPQHQGKHSLKELTRFKEYLLEHYASVKNPTLTLEELKSYTYSFIR